MPSGFLLVDKPVGITSHDVVDHLRKKTGIKKIGHAGTLDPFATGLLIIAIERSATKYIQEFVGMDKVYEATFVIGATTPSLDPETEVIKSDQVTVYSDDQVKEAMAKLTGEIEQIPPMYSAVKVKGRRLYKHAREGEVIEREPRNVSVYAFELLGSPRQMDGLVQIDVRIHCSSGTYVRALARDLGKALGTSGYAKSLRRISIGDFHVKDAISLEKINEENWLTFLKSQEEMGIDG